MISTINYNIRKNDPTKVNPFVAFVLVKKKILDNGKEFYSFHDGDYVIDIEDDGYVKTSSDLNDALIYENEADANEVYNFLINKIRKKELKYDFIFVQDFNELAEYTAYCLHYPNEHYADFVQPVKIFQSPSTRQKAVLRANAYKKSNLLNYIEKYARSKNKIITNNEYYYLSEFCDAVKLEGILLANRGRNDFDVYICEHPKRRALFEK